MPNVDEALLTAAKLREQVRGNLDGGEPLHHHAGFVKDDRDRRALSFVEDAVDGFADTSLGQSVYGTLATDAATDAVVNANGSLASHLVGVTEQELDASSLTVTARLMNRLENESVLTTVLAAGAPNSGKTNTMFLLTGDMSRAVFGDDLLVISNSESWSGADRSVSSMHDLMVLLVEERDRPKTFVLDEGSRYMDSRTFSREVAMQWSPAQKAMSKLGVEVAGVIGHTGKDVVPETKRLSNLAFWKDAPAEARFYERWDGEADRPSAPLFSADLTHLEPTASDYDPDDVASWSWDLDPDVWDGFEDWAHFGDRLRDLGPTE